jgi:RimJ/RimL family protein N-acetyltransferase
LQKYVATYIAMSLYDKPVFLESGDIVVTSYVTRMGEEEEDDPAVLIFAQIQKPENHDIQFREQYTSPAKIDRSLVFPHRVTLTIWSGLDLVGIIQPWDYNAKKRSLQLGYELFAEFRGRGIMTEVVRMVTQHAFDVLGLDTVYIYCDPTNEKSSAVARRAGFTLERFDDVDNLDVWAKHREQHDVD